MDMDASHIFACVHGITYICVFEHSHLFILTQQARLLTFPYVPEIVPLYCVCLYPQLYSYNSTDRGKDSLTN